MYYCSTCTVDWPYATHFERENAKGHSVKWTKKYSGIMYTKPRKKKIKQKKTYTTRLYLVKADTRNTYWQFVVGDGGGAADQDADKRPYSLGGHWYCCTKPVGVAAAAVGVESGAGAPSRFDSDSDCGRYSGWIRTVGSGCDSASPTNWNMVCHL